MASPEFGVAANTDMCIYFSREYFYDLQRCLPASLLQYNDGSYGVVPARDAGPVELPPSGADPPRLFVSVDGSLAPRSILTGQTDRQLGAVRGRNGPR